jgi:hypothetical protein
MSATPMKIPQLTPERIAEEAYFLYLKRGSRPGSDLDNWLEAERNLREQLPRLPDLKPQLSTSRRLSKNRAQKV